MKDLETRPCITLTVDAAVLAQTDALAKPEGLTRSAFMRRALLLDLARRSAAQPQEGRAA